MEVIDNLADVLDKYLLEKNGGVTLISPNQLSNLSDMIGNSLINPLDEIEKYKSSYDSLAVTERQTVILSRIGQGKFREDLLLYWGGKCAVTGCQMENMLLASHIKPWRVASNQERLDIYNGLLLIPNLDAAFDAGLISFENDGKIMISHLLENKKNSLGIHPNLRIYKLQTQHKKYLQFHRKNIFIYE